MIGHQLKYELISLIRNRWIQILSILLLVLCLFAAFNGQEKVNQRQADIQDAMDEMAEGDRLAITLIDSIEAGFSVSVSSWTRPDKPTALGNYHPRVAAMPSAPLAGIAIGQSDLYTHYVKPTIYGDEVALNFTELTSPVQLLFGSFDLSFVLIYLLPLIVIAFSYDMLSKEREQGSLRLLASQPLSMLKWLIAKAGLRFGVLALITILAIVLAMTIARVGAFSDPGGLLQVILLAVAYLCFWFVLAMIVNLAGKSSANNAVSLLALWVVLVLLIPATINQLANNLYPVPSRAQLINDMRVMKADASKKQDEILGEYLRNHPELMVNEAKGGEGTAYSWWAKYFASRDLVEKEMAPLIAGFENQLEQQQDWVNRWRFLSPAILMQRSLNYLAGTSTQHYQVFRDQVIVFSGEWRNFLLPLIFHDRPVTKEVMAVLPAFTYNDSVVHSEVGVNLAAILVISLAVGIFGVYRYKASMSTIAVA